MTVNAILYYALLVLFVWLSGNLAATGDYGRSVALVVVAAILLALRDVLTVDDEGEG